MRSKKKNPQFLQSPDTGKQHMLNPELEGNSFFWDGGKIGILLLTSHFLS